MKISLLRSPGSKPMAACWILLFSVSATRLATAAPLQEARVSQVIQDVRLLEAHGAPRPAVVNDKVTLERAVRTGKESRAELTFTDLTITRLGANTIFSLRARAREVDLTSGTILLAVPSGAAPVRANTTAVTAAVTGGTALLATGPPTKFMVLEGIGTIYPKGHPEKAVTVHAGDMVVVTEDGSMTEPVPFDVWLVLRTSPLITDFPPLPNLPSILEVANQQRAEQLAFAPTRLPSQSWVNVIDVTDLNANANPILVAARIGTRTPPPPTPSKFGTPPVITSPVPYVITSGTNITTDPSITTNGVTDYGKIYRGPAVDGAFSLWAFGSTLPFDIAVDDVFFANPNHFPIAAFKFQSLSLNGNPTIDLSNGGVTKLALIGVAGITSGPPGGTLTFTGLDLLVLATVNGSINLTSDVSFQGLSELAMYARGAGSNLILNSPISNIGILELAAEGSLQLTNPGTMSVGEFLATAGSDLTLQIGGSLLLNGKVDLNTLVLPGTTVTNGANVTLNITGDYTNTSATEFSLLRVRNEGAHIGTGGNINVNIGSDLTTTGTGGDFALLVQNTSGQIENGGNIILTVDGSVSTQGQLRLLVENYDQSGNPSGHIGTGGNISVTTGEDLTADSIVAFVNNRNGGLIGSGGNVTLNIGGALITQHNAITEQGEQSLFLLISNRNDGSGGGTIGSDVALTLNAASVSVGGNLFAVVSTNAGGSDRSGTIDINTSGNLMTQGDADIEIENFGFSVGGVFLPGGTIAGDATIAINAANISTGGLLDVEIDNFGGGHIGQNAIIDFGISGDINSNGDVFVGITNTPNGPGTPAGTIGGNAAINVSAANLTANSLLAQIDNSNGGAIGGNAAINMNVPGTTTVTNDAAFEILGSDGAASAAININGGSYNVGGTFLSYIDGNGTITFNNASAHADVLKAGVFGANGVLNIGGGVVSADTTLKLYAPGSNGQLNFVSNVTLCGNSLKILAADSVTIFNNVVVTIAGPVPADVYTNHANYTGFGGNHTTTGTFAGAGANDPQPLANAPPFGPLPPGHHHTRGGISGPPQFNAPRQLNVSNTEELLALLDNATVGPDGRITMSSSTSTSNLRNLSRMNMNALPREARRILMQQMRERSITRVGGKRIL